MDVIPLTLGVAFAACCVWLTVRIVNRRERWAKRALVVWLSLGLAGYPLSIGPAFWIASRNPTSGQRFAMLPRAYWPVGWVAMRVDLVNRGINAYARVGMREQTIVGLPFDATSDSGYTYGTF